MRLLARANVHYLSTYGRVEEKRLARSLARVADYRVIYLPGSMTLVSFIIAAAAALQSRCARLMRLSLERLDPVCVRVGDLA